eukprot:5132878-Prymnesium_polylepis.1
MEACHAARCVGSSAAGMTRGGGGAGLRRWWRLRWRRLQGWRRYCQSRRGLWKRQRRLRGKRRRWWRQRGRGERGGNTGGGGGRVSGGAQPLVVELE